MTEVSTGFSTALGVGTFASTSDSNYWYLNANAGDHVTIRLEAQNPNNYIYPQLYLENVSGTSIASVGGSYYGDAELDNVTIPTPGTYFVDVFSNYNTASYQLRVDQSEANVGPPARCHTRRQSVEQHAAERDLAGPGQFRRQRRRRPAGRR